LREQSQTSQYFSSAANPDKHFRPPKKWRDDSQIGFGIKEVQKSAHNEDAGEQGEEDQVSNPTIFIWHWVRGSQFALAFVFHVNSPILAALD
jgi:hypothetical protein